DAVTGVGDAADLFAGGRARAVGPHVAVQGVPDLLRTDRKLRHNVFSSLPAVLWAEWVVCMVVLKASAGQVPLRLVEASEDGAVDDLVADLHADPADDVLLVDDLEHDGLAVGPLQGTGEAGALLLGEVDRRRHDGGELLTTLGGDGEVLIDGPVEASTAGGEHRLAGQPDRLGPGLVPQEAADELGLPGGIALTVAQCVTQLRTLGDDALEAEELVLDPIDRARVLGPLESGLHAVPLQAVGEVSLLGPPLRGELRDEPRDALGDLVPEQLRHESGLVRTLPRRVGDGAAQGPVVVEQRGHGEELVRDDDRV